VINPAEHMGIVHKMLRKFRFPDHLKDDLVQEGFLALTRAAQLFDPEKGAWFSYAARRVTSHIYRELQRETRGGLTDLAWDNSKPYSVVPVDWTQVAADDDASHRLGRFEQATRERIVELSVAEAIDEDSAEESLDLGPALAKLPSGDREVLLGLACGASFSETGKRLGISKQAAAQKSVAALKKMRKLMAV
jgi:RNA polymerase sigma factor (sigma-70 family)